MADDETTTPASDVPADKPARVRRPRKADAAIAVASADDVTTELDSTPEQGVRRSLKRWRIIAASLAVVTLLAVGGAVYMVTVVTAWDKQNAQLRATSTSLGETVSEQTATIESQTAELTLVTEQLETSNEQIVDLANKQAQAFDDRETLFDLARGLQFCAEKRAEVIDEMRRGRYTTASIRAVANEVADYCADVFEILDTVDDEWDF